MGIGSEISEWDDYEWFDLATVISPAATPYVDSMLAWVRANPLWSPDGGVRVLLVDLDNLRAEPARLRARIEATVLIARDADYAAFAGQPGSVQRARPHLAEFADRALAVGHGGDEADWALLDAASAAGAEIADGQRMQFVVVSNDNIFASLADRGSLVVLSPGAEALSDRLRDSAELVVDMARLERAVVVPQ